MRPKFLGPKRVEPPIEPAEFDEYDQLTLRLFAKSAIFVTAFVIGMVQVLAWVAEKVG